MFLECDNGMEHQNLIILWFEILFYLIYYELDIKNNTYILLKD